VARHRFDPIAFVLGCLAIAAAAVVLGGGELTDQGRILLPVGLITLGIALLIEVARRPTTTSPAPAGAFDLDAGLAGTGARGSDLDDLFAPVDDVLSTWDDTRPGARPTDEDTALLPTAADDPAATAGPEDTAASPGLDDPTVTAGPGDTAVLPPADDTAAESAAGDAPAPEDDGGPAHGDPG
jgi:hypothetical protein